MATTERTQIDIRDVTDAEVETIFEKGWVQLPGLVGQDVAARLLEGAKAVLGTGEGRPARTARRFASRENETLRAFVTDPGLGRNAARLLGRDSSIRLLVDSLAATAPWPAGSRVPEPTFQQDGLVRPLDRVQVAFWIALDEVTPEMGSLELFSGSHRMGPLGRRPLDAERRAAWRFFDRWPRERPGALQPGDAIAHLSTVVQGAAPNTGDRVRWTYSTVHFPTDARFLNIPSPYTDGLGLQPWDLLDRPDFPVTYRGSSPDIPTE